MVQKGQESRAVQSVKTQEELTALEKQLREKYSKEVVALGDSAVFVARDEAGFVRIVYKDLVLKEGTHFNKISKKYALNSEGYNRANQIANITLVSPSTIIVDGREMPNPYVERSPKTGLIEMVWIRRVGVGFAPTGNLVIVDKSLVFSLSTYLIQDIQSKIKDSPACGTWGVEKTPPEKWQGVNIKWTGPRDNRKRTESKVEVAAAECGALEFIPVKELGQTTMGMWVDFSHPDIQAAFNEYTQRLKFADRIADTICSRNVLRSHPAIGIFDVTDRYDSRTKTAKVRVYGYRHDLSIKDFKDIAQAAQNGDMAKATEVAGGRVEIQQDMEPEEVAYEDVKNTGSAVAEEEQANAPKRERESAQPNDTESESVPETDQHLEASPREILAEKAKSGEIQPFEIIERANDMGFKVAVYSKLNDEQAAAVLASFASE